MTANRLLLLFLCLGAISAHADSLLFVTNGNAGTLVTYTGSGSFVGSAPVTGGTGFPQGVAIGPDGNVYVADQSQGGVEQFSGTTGAFLNQFIPSDFNSPASPTALAFDATGRLYVGYWGTGNHSFVDVYDNTGAFLEHLLPTDAAPGGLDDPTGIGLAGGNIYVTDQVAGVNAFDATGNYLFSIPIGASVGGLAVGPDGNLYVTDNLNGGQVNIFSQSGTPLGVFGSSLVQPLGITFGPDGNIYVTDDLGVEEFDGTTDNSLGTFISDPTNLSNPQYLAFGTPEPSTLVLMAAAAALAFFLRKRLAHGR